MKTREIIEEEQVTSNHLNALFKRAFYSVSIDKDGDLVVRCDDCQFLLQIRKNRKLLRYLKLYKLRGESSQQARHALVNKLNATSFFPRFCVPESHPNTLMAEYFLPFEEGIPAFQIVAALRLFSRIVRRALRENDEGKLVEKDE